MTRRALTPTAPSEAEAALAKQTGKVLSRRARGPRPLRLRLLDDPANETVELPSSAVRMLVRILEEMAQGNTVTLAPVRPEISTQEAAGMLNMSRPSLIKLLETGAIAFRSIGTHRRVQLESLVAYKRRLDARRRAVLGELAAYDQELRL